jgi:RNA polymerase sigma-70 factor (ECF subfamily)
MRRETSLPGDSGGGSSVAPAALTAALDAASARRLRRVALRITRDPSAADDVVQSAFEKALRHRDTFRGDAKASTWLHRIVVNEALMWRRGEARRRLRCGGSFDAAILTSVDPTAPALDGLLEQERCERLHRALLSLRSEDRELLVRCALEGQSQVEWARAARTSSANAKTRAFRARRALRSALEKDRG